MAAPAAAQHEHHGVPAGGPRVVLMGAALSAEGTPLSGAIVQLLHGTGPGAHLMATAVSDATGRFIVRASSGTYTLEVSYPGHQPHRRQVTLGTAPFNVGSVRLELRPMELGTVTARAERIAVALRSGSTVVDTRASPAAGGSVADLLRTVPGVELDADERISMRGSTGVLVLMNGRRIPLTGDALAAFLRRMPAAALERIEASTTASASQGADGATGVVNLVFRDGTVRRTGMRSVAGSMAWDDHYMGTAAITGDMGDALTWDMTYSMSRMRPRTHSKTARWSVLPGDPPLQTEEASRAREKHQLHTVLAGAAVTPTPRTSVALRGSYSGMEGAYRSSSAFVYTDPAGNTEAIATGSLLEHLIPSGDLSAIAGVDLGAVRFASEARASFVREDFDGAYYDRLTGSSYMTAVMASRQRERVLRNDLGLRFPGISLDLGHESRLRTFTATEDATHFNVTVSQAYHYELDAHAGYLTSQRSIGGARAEAGLRVEADRTRIRLENATTLTSVRVFPTLKGEWTDARRALVYRVAYGRRINRPGSEMLNPFTMGSNDSDEIVGNPSLLPEISDQVEFGVERHRPRLTLQLTPFLRDIRDPIRQLKALTASGGATTTLANLARTRALGADGSVRAQPLDGVVATLAGSVAHIKTTGDLLGSSGVYATARLTVDFRVAENTAAHFYAYRRSAQAIEQGAILPAFSSDLALTQRLHGGRARVTLRVNDPLGTGRVEYRIAEPTFTQESRRRTVAPLLSLFASYAVGGAPREDAPVRKEGPARIF